MTRRVAHSSAAAAAAAALDELAIEEEPSSFSLPSLMALETSLSTFDMPLSMPPEALPDMLPDMLEEPLCAPEEEEGFEDELPELPQQPANSAATSTSARVRTKVFLGKIQTPFRLPADAGRRAGRSL